MFLLRFIETFIKMFFISLAIIIILLWPFLKAIAVGALIAVIVCLGLYIFGLILGVYCLLTGGFKRIESFLSHRAQGKNWMRCLKESRDNNPYRGYRDGGRTNRNPHRGYRRG